MVDVSQCPFCELRFPTRVELEDHIATDHPGVMPGDEVDDDTRTLPRRPGEAPR
jgi:hypothetical protein